MTTGALSKPVWRCADQRGSPRYFSAIGNDDDGLIVHLLILVVHAKHNRAVDAEFCSEGLSAEF